MVLSEGTRLQSDPRHDVAAGAFADLHVEGRTQLGRLPALDGLRGLAVAAVVAFHAGYPQMVGGYLGVSTFFTLSGFLITSLLMAGRLPGQSLTLRGFWGRRIRRLYPASVVTLLAVVILFAPFVATADQLVRMPADILSSLFNVANWRFILEGSSYEDLFVAPSPVLHFWSLAIEEQFYLVFPVLIWAIWKAAKGRLAVVGAVLSALTVAAILWTVLGGLSTDRIYFGTDTRAPELLLGALLALLIRRRSVRAIFSLRYRWRVTIQVLGTLAFATQMWWWWSLPQSTEWLYRGGFAGYALLSVLVILAAVVPGGVLGTIMSVAPLRWLGSRSYAIYLVHWPIMLTFRQMWPELPQWRSVGWAVLITVVLAEASFRFLERPIRDRRWPSVRLAPVSVFGSAALVIALVILVIPSDPPGQSTDFAAALARFDSEIRTDPTTSESPDAGSPAEPTLSTPSPAVAHFGDSTVLGVGWGMGVWGKSSGQFSSVEGDSRFGCSVVRFERQKTFEEFTPGPQCTSWPQDWPQLLDEHDPDVAVLLSPAWTTLDSIVPGDDTYRALGDPLVDEFVVSEYIEAVDLLSSQGALVLLATYPQTDERYGVGKVAAIKRQADPQRMHRLNELMNQVAEARPETSAVLDIATMVGGRYDDQVMRLDGLHYELGGFDEIAAESAGPALTAIWDQHWRENLNAGDDAGADLGGDPPD